MTSTNGIFYDKKNKNIIKIKNIIALKRKKKSKKKKKMKPDRKWWTALPCPIAKS